MFLKTLDGHYINSQFIYDVNIRSYDPYKTYTVYVCLVAGNESTIHDIYKSDKKEDCEKYIEDTFVKKNKTILG